MNALIYISIFHMKTPEKDEVLRTTVIIKKEMEM